MTPPEIEVLRKLAERPHRGARSWAEIDGKVLGVTAQRLASRRLARSTYSTKHHGGTKAKPVRVWEITDAGRERLAEIDA